MFLLNFLQKKPSSSEKLGFFSLIMIISDMIHFVNEILKQTKIINYPMHLYNSLDMILSML